MADNFYSSYPVEGSSGSGVDSVNSLTGALTIAAGSGITVTPSGGDTLTIAATGSGANQTLSNLTAPTALNASLNFTSDSTIQTIDDVSSSSFVIKTGIASAGTSGELNISTGNVAGGDSGPLFLTTGNSTTGASGNISVVSGSGDGDVSGNIIIASGPASTEPTGNITLTTGISDADASGNIVLTTGASGGGSGQGRVLVVAKSLGIPIKAADPSGPAEGDMYYNSVTHKAYIYDGTIWQALF